jgi:hypothetical protein
MSVFKYELVDYQITNIPSKIEELIYTKLATGGRWIVKHFYKYKNEYIL